MHSNNQLDWVLDQRRVELLRRQVAFRYKRESRRVMITLLGVAILAIAMAATAILFLKVG